VSPAALVSVLFTALTQTYSEDAAGGEEASPLASAAVLRLLLYLGALLWSLNRMLITLDWETTSSQHLHRQREDMDMLCSGLFGLLLRWSEAQSFRRRGCCTGHDLQVWHCVITY
jgi:hypothetical protein